jgi:hypothetical protein
MSPVLRLAGSELLRVARQVGASGISRVRRAAIAGCEPHGFSRFRFHFRGPSAGAGAGFDMPLAGGEDARPGASFGELHPVDLRGH